MLFLGQMKSSDRADPAGKSNEQEADVAEDEPRRVRGPAQPAQPPPDSISGFDAALRLLEGLADDHSLLAQLDADARRRLQTAAGRISRPERDQRRALRRTREKQERDALREADARILEETGIRSKRQEAVFSTPSVGAPLPAKALRAFTGKGRTPHRPAPIPANDSGPTGILPEPVGSDARESTRLQASRNCYICKQDFFEVHPFYDAMCRPCADFNWLKRIQTCDLSGRIAVVTGGRVKIGYQAVIKLLRARAYVIVTTRFPRDAAARFALEEDFEDYRERLEIHGLDLRHTPSVEAFARDVEARHDRLDFILNNACQTVRRPPGFYNHMMQAERVPLHSLPEAEQALLGAHAEHVASLHGASVGDSDLLAPTAGELYGLQDAPGLSQIPLTPDDYEAASALFPAGNLDADLQQVDLRDRNSWRLRLDEVPSVELLEVHLVNAIAPFVLNARLKSLMLQAPGRDKHIVNVSAMEGQFYRTFKTDKHPHTNMAKAGLNMLTRTSAPDYARDGIFMNSVDTGWITDEDPVEIAERKRAEHGFHPPLDIVDAAARICDPIFSGLNTGHHAWGQFFKDYRSTDW